MHLARLTSQRPALRRLLLIPSHARRKIDSGWYGKPEASRCRSQIELASVKDCPQAMRRVSGKVAAEGILGGAVQVVVGCDQLLELSLDVDELREVVFNR